MPLLRKIEHFSFLLCRRLLKIAFVIIFMVIEMRLTEISEGQTVRLVDIHLPGEQRRRLMHVGFYEGIRIRFIRRAPMGDPSIYEVCGNAIILRKADAQHIEVEVDV